MTAVSLASTNGGGKPTSKAEDFRLALLALGEGRLVDNVAGEQPEGPRGNAATVRVEAELPCYLQVRRAGGWVLASAACLLSDGNRRV